MAYLDVRGLRETQQRLDDVGRRATRPEVALRSSAVLDDLMAGERRQFASGYRWPKVTPEWARDKRRRGLDPRVMRATGRLERALTGNGQGLRFHAFSGVLTFGIPAGRSDIYYAQALAKRRRRKYRAVRIDPMARGRISQRVRIYIATGALNTSLVEVEY